MPDLRPPPRFTQAFNGLAMLLAAIALTLVNQSALPWRENSNDSHLFVYYGWSVAHGAVPYLDVWDNKPPGVWWANALGFCVTRELNLSELVVAGTALLITLLAFTAMAREALGRALAWPALAVGGVVLTHAAYECGANRTETFVMGCETVAVWAWFAWRRRGGAGWLALCGLAAGAAPWVKQSGLGAAIACGAGLMITVVADGGRPARERWRLLGTWIAALLAPSALAVSALAAQGALAEAAYAIAGFNRLYFSRSGASWIPMEGLRVAILEHLAPLGGLFLLALVGVIVIAARAILRRRLAETAPVALLACWLLACLYLASVGGGQRYHLMICLPPLAGLALSPLWALSAGDAPDAGLARRLTQPTWTLATVIVLGLLAPVAADSLDEMRIAWNAKPHWYSLSRRAPAPYEAQGAEVARFCTPAETVYVWGWSPGTYRYAERRCPSRFATLEKVGQLGDAARFILEGAQRDIQADPPRVFVLPEAAWRELVAARPNDFWRWIREQYRAASVIEGMRLLVRREPERESAPGL